MLKDSIQIDCHQRIQDVEKEWRSLEATHSALTIYQCYDWVEAWCRNVLNHSSQTKQHRVVIVTITLAGKVVALFPFYLRVYYGFRILGWLGDDHFNYHGGLIDREFLTLLDHDNFPDLWSKVENELPDYHVLWLTHQPRYLYESLSPFRCIGDLPAPNSGHQLVFQHHRWDQLLAELRSKSTRKRIRNDESRLSREGSLSWKRIDTIDEVNRYLDILFQQRKDRFRRLGIPLEENIKQYINFYSDLLNQAIKSGSDFVHMMVLELDGTVLATMVLAEQNGRIYPLINSMTNTRFRQWSPGDYLLRIVIRNACDENAGLIDFGLAEDNNYKTVWCNTKTELFESIKGRGLAGAAIASLFIAGITLKRRIKQSPRLWAWYRSLRSGNFKKLLKA